VIVSLWFDGEIVCRVRDRIRADQERWRDEHESSGDQRVLRRGAIVAAQSVPNALLRGAGGRRVEP
jgi:hypothetical protein